MPLKIMPLGRLRDGPLKERGYLAAAGMNTAS
jgi:hypothetical protein